MPTFPDNTPASHERPLVGIISDSHGEVAPLAAALDFLRERGCRTIHHLGDICDSLHPETADACVQLLRSYGVNGVKGNNDHTVIVNQVGREIPSLKAETLDFLERLPLVAHDGRLVLAHSLPFESELGLSCMVGAMHHQHALQFFRRFPDRILVRGHSHSPEITRQDGSGHIDSESIPLEEAMHIAPRRGCIVTCGALDHGLCLLWSPADSSVVSLHFRD